MPRAASLTPTSDKFTRYREKKAQQGLKMVRVWVMDPRRPEFREEARRQGQLLRGRADEAEALDFIEEAGDWA